MMNWALHFPLALFLLTFCGVQAQEPLLKASELQWTMIFGSRIVDQSTTPQESWHEVFGGAPSRSDTIYCLLGRGFFRADRSDDVDSLIAAWIHEHPNALVIPVTITGPVMIDEPGSRQVYCWLVDGDENLNELVVRRGGYLGGTMVRPETWDELQQWEKDLFPEEEKGSGATVLVDPAVYDAFIARINDAEEQARTERIGIWKIGAGGQ